MKFNLRLMQKKDIEMLYKHLHLKYVEKYFKNDNKQWEIHKKWYESILRLSDYIYYIVEDENNNFIGFVSFEIERRVAKVGIFIVEDFRNKKYSKEILEQSLVKIKEDRNNVKRVIANILGENIISKKLFLSSNFEFYKKKTINKVQYFLYKKNL